MASNISLPNDGDRPSSSSSTASSSKGKRCVAFGCSNFYKDGVSLHLFPLKNPPVLKQWVAFVKRKRSDWPGPTRYSCLCSAHFTPDCYPMKYRVMESAGTKIARKDLVKDAVPTIDSVSISDQFSNEESSSQSKKRKRMAFTKRENARVSKTSAFLFKLII